MTPIHLTDLTPTQHEGWEVLLDLGSELSDDWCLVGGQLVWLLAQEHAIRPPRATEDVDIVLDVRARPTAIRRASDWLERNGFSLSDTSPEGIGHQYVRSADEGNGKIKFDVLAPDHLGTRSDLTTSPPARTVEVPGGRYALDEATRVPVKVGSRAGPVRRPSVVATIVLKAAATTIAGRVNPERDWSDVAFLLSLVGDPIATREALPGQVRKRLQRHVGAMLDRRHPAWTTVGDRADLGQTALAFLLEP